MQSNSRLDLSLSKFKSLAKASKFTLRHLMVVRSNQLYLKTL